MYTYTHILTRACVCERGYWGNIFDSRTLKAVPQRGHSSKDKVMAQTRYVQRLENKFDHIRGVKTVNKIAVFSPIINPTFRI